jgi:hypothetical protein
MTQRHALGRENYQCKALRYQIGDVHVALITLAEKEERHNPDIVHEATTLSHQLKDFSFIGHLV